MSTIRTTTAKSVIYTIDGYSSGYGAYIQGNFVGKYIVPKQHAHYVDDRAGDELATLREMHQQKRFGIILRNAGRIQ